jgi:Transposase DDE domain
LTSDEHFTVDGTLEAWASAKSFQSKEGKQSPPGNPTVNFRGEQRSNETHASKSDPCGSGIDGRTTRYLGYAISQRKRKRIEECFGWLKTIALMRKVRHRGVCKVDSIFTFACAAYNLVRMRNLAAAVPAL